MADTPGPLRGNLYSTHLTRRCPTFKQCNVCKMCENYNPTHLQCNICESRKPKGTVCSCPPSTKLNMIKIEEKLKRPMFQMDPDAKVNPEGVEVAFDKDWEEIRDDISSKWGQLSPLQEE
jgi:hypothetical protein